MPLTCFFKNTRGGTVPLLALALVPIMGGVGAAGDYSRAAGVRTAMQAALDATALMLSKDAKGMAEVAVQQRATDYFNAIFKDAAAVNVSITATLTEPAAGNFKLRVAGAASIPTVFSQYLGYTQMDIGADTEVLWRMKKLNLALALDNTGSMASSSKMTELKKAAKSLLTTLKTAEKSAG